MNQRIDSLQALRGVAALSVAVLHCFHIASKVGVPMGEVPTLAIGVDIFFVLSGFLMFTLVGQGGTGAAAGAIFFVKRALRIYPLWWLALTVQVGILVLGGQPVGADRLVKSILLVPDVPGVGAPILPVGWTLTFELFFYSLVAAAVFLGLTGARALTAVAAVLVGLVGADIATGFGNPLLDWYGRSNVLEFALGGVLAAVLPSIRRTMGGAVLGLAALVGGLGLLVATWGEYDHGATVAMIAYLLVIGAVLVGDIVSWDGMVGRAARWLGDVSYSTYLWHLLVAAVISPALPGLQAEMGDGLGFGAYVLLVLAATLAASAASYAWLERPLSRAAACWLSRRPERAMVAKPVVAAE